MIYCKARYLIIEVIINNWQGVRYSADVLEEICEYLRLDYVYQKYIFVNMTKKLVSWKKERKCPSNTGIKTKLWKNRKYAKLLSVVVY